MALHLVLRIVEGPDAGREFTVDGSTTVGRDAAAGVVLDDVEVSRLHARISVEGEDVTIEDLGSSNGTFVNGSRLGGSQPLGDGDVLNVGTTVLKVQSADPEKTIVRPPAFLDPEKVAEAPTPAPVPAAVAAASASASQPVTAASSTAGAPPEAVPAEEATNVLGRRIAAYLIDAVVTAALVTALWFALVDSHPKATTTGGGIVIGSKRYGFDSDTKRAIFLVAVGVFALLISWILPAVRGKTPGKWLMKIRIVRADGRPPGFGRAFVRWILWIADGIAFNLVGFIVALRSRYHQRIGDMVAGTYVVHDSAAGRPLALAPASS